jgi:hypothetical protein
VNRDDLAPTESGRLQKGEYLFEVTMQVHTLATPELYAANLCGR